MFYLLINKIKLIFALEIIRISLLKHSDDERTNNHNPERL